MKKKLLITGVVLTLLFFVYALLPEAVAAQSGDTFGLQDVGDNVALEGGDIRVTIAKIIRAVLGLLGVIVLGLVLYAGFMIMTSGGNEEKVAQGKRILTNAIIGLLIILSSVAITQFIINRLSSATNSGGFGSGSGSGSGSPNFQTFAGSGSLGRIITDHYPESGQTGIARNTKIFVTFAESIVPESLIENTNQTCWANDPAAAGSVSVPISQNDGNDCAKDNEGVVIPYYGDCVDLDGNGIDMATECDRLIGDAVQIVSYLGEDAETGTAIESAALTTYDANRSATTFTFYPLNPLGSATADVWHRVTLTNDIERLVEGQRIPVFSGQRYSLYTWQFQTNTTVDTDPPHVVSTLPRSGETIARNNIIRVTFNEPMDPVAVQGVFAGDSTFTNAVLQGAGFDSATENPIVGEWRITNGYRTIEFLSSLPCGQNSCGEVMYCLPTSCAANDTSCTMSMNALIRTAAVQNPEEGFASIPLTGVTDAAGNALDNGPDNQPDGVLADPHKPATPPDLRTIGDAEQSPDNFYWTFTVRNTIDRSAPYIETITPGIDAQGVLPNDPVQISFSKEMMYTSLRNISIEEYGAESTDLDSLWYKSSAIDNSETKKTTVAVKHREFGPNGLALYYLPQIPSTVKSTNQNCMYPGYGPDTDSTENGATPTCLVRFTESGTIGSTANCTPVTSNANTDTGCATINGRVPSAQADIATCVQQIKSVSPLSVE